MVPSELAQLSKLQPPSIEGAPLLTRSRLHQLLARVDGVQFQIAQIEAQAGQGKTVCVVQYLNAAGSAHCWYQLEQEDGDPLLLAANLVAAIRLQAGGFAPLKLEHMLEHGEFGPEDVEQIADLLLEILQKTELICVFNDVHHIAGFAQSERLLALLLQGASVSLRFFLLSRHALPQVISSSLPAGRTLRLGNAELAFNHHEIAELFNTVISRPLTLGAVAELQRVTEGWSMGLRLLGLGLPDESADKRQQRLAALDIKGHSIIDFFMREVFSVFPLTTRESLLRLSLLERIPMALAKKLANDGQAGPDLKALLADNLFIRFHEGDTDTFAFHHLFRDTLRGMALRQLPPAEITAVQTAAATWYRDAGQYEEALHYYLAAAGFEQAEETLKEIGFELMAENRLVTLTGFLAEVPEEVISSHPWFGYFRGLLHLNTAPPLALDEFEQARRKFEEAADNIGELLCLIETVAFHVTVDGAFNTACPLLARAEELFPVAAALLHPRYHLHAASILALAAIFIHSDFTQAQHYNKISAQLADQEGTANARAISLLGMLFTAMFANDFARCAELAEQAAPVLRDQGLSSYWQMVLRVMLCDYLYVSGQFDSYRHHSQVVREAASADLAVRSLSGPLMLMWDVDIAFSCGDPAKARQLLNDALVQNEHGLTIHMRSQYLAYQALIDAYEGKVGALSVVAEARQLREQSGGVYHVNECLVANAGVHALLGEKNRAGELLAQSQRLAAVNDQGFLALPTLACQAWLAMESGDAAIADARVKEFMARLRRYEAGHFYAWLPKIVCAVLSRAVRLGCEAERARRLAAARLAVAIDDDGSCVPLLTIRTLGGLRLERGGVGLSARDIGPQHRRLLTLLLASPNHQLHASRLQCELWPDSSEKKARATFDVLLLRLRRLFEETFGAGAGKWYLPQKNGVLSLVHCRIDAHLFRERAEAGLKHLARGEGWRADNEFRRAAAIWQGEFLAHETTTYETEVIREGLQATFRRMATAWTKLHLSWGDAGAAVAIAEQAFNIAPTDAELVKALYQANILNETPHKAQKTLSNYRSALLSSGYDPAEADEALKELWDA
jgi:ATP/maltotriose-dependent transcriptional regulator MalT